MRNVPVDGLPDSANPGGQIIGLPPINAANGRYGKGILVFVGQQNPAQQLKTGFENGRRQSPVCHFSLPTFCKVEAGDGLSTAPLDPSQGLQSGTIGQAGGGQLLVEKVAADSLPALTAHIFEGNSAGWVRCEPFNSTMGLLHPGGLVTAVTAKVSCAVRLLLEHQLNLGPRSLFGQDEWGREL